MNMDNRTSPYFADKGCTVLVDGQVKRFWMSESETSFILYCDDATTLSNSEKETKVVVFEGRLDEVAKLYLEICGSIVYDRGPSLSMPAPPKRNYKAISYRARTVDPFIALVIGAGLMLGGVFYLKSGVGTHEGPIFPQAMSSQQIEQYSLPTQDNSEMNLGLNLAGVISAPPAKSPDSLIPVEQFKDKIKAAKLSEAERLDLISFFDEAEGKPDLTTADFPHYSRKLLDFLVESGFVKPVQDYDTPNRIIHLPSSVVDKYKQGNGIPTIPEDGTWIGLGNSVKIPLPGGGDIETEDDMLSFGLEP
ncbi:hypothetical protein [Flexibacterium corallicola]|uniref:hypothetical protein n=1 Tax=Flexibacterium corallicola TaxID=3037259 RepID=UPI00286F9AC8|nr:hypothetical protein [Pseudovibrio sp. M1P-2-3]